MNRIRLPALIAGIVISNASLGAGVGPWSFGMTRDEVRAQVEFGPYYSFKNNDIGTQSGLLDGKQTPTSFYFASDKLKRVMFITYQGTDFPGVKAGWEVCLAHLQKNFHEIEVPNLRAGPTSAEEARAFLEKSGLREDPKVRVQMGPLRMPEDKRVWCSAYRVGPEAIMVSLNYAEP